MISITASWRYGATMPELKYLRQWGSRTPGHPENGETPGVEATTDPLGQDFGDAVAWPLPRWLSRPASIGQIMPSLTTTYVLFSDGEPMERISSWDLLRDDKAFGPAEARLTGLAGGGWPIPLEDPNACLTSNGR